MSQNYVYPSSSDVTLTGTGNGLPIPTTSILVAGENPAGLQEPLQTDTAGNLIVSPLTTSSVVTVVQPNGALLHTTVDSSALPAGASTAALQTTGNSFLSSLDGKTVHVDTGNVTVVASALPSGGSTAALQTSGNASLTSLDGKTVHVDTGAVVVASSALPSGASTLAAQTTGNTSLASIDTKTPALGQALAAASVPVVLTAAQLTSLTPLTSVTVTQATGTNLHTVVDSGTVVVTQPTGTNLHAVLDAGTAVIGHVILDAGTAAIGTVKSQAATPTALTISQAAITVGTTAVRLTVAGTAPSATRVVLVATPDVASTATFYIGSATVTNSGATRGIEIAAGQSFIANNDAGDYYIVSSTAAQTVTVMEQA